VTVIVEGRRDRTVVAWVVIAFCALGGWRGMAQSPVVAGIFVVLAVAAVVGWITWFLRKPRQLTISSDEITYGRPDHVDQRIPRSAGPLALRRSRYALSLAPWDDPQLAGITLLGFDVPEVAAACTSHGWEFPNAA
jgi:hypothetical protein